LANFLLYEGTTFLMIALFLILSFLAFTILLMGFFEIRLPFISYPKEICYGRISFPKPPVKGKVKLVKKITVHKTQPAAVKSAMAKNETSPA
jgi:Na+-transporting methylmalonyl-CoA/oxaloacetate decarboxylase gamma subunit